MKIGVRLTITFIIIAFSSMMLVSYIAYKHGKDALETEAFNKLTAVREMKGAQIENYFQLINDQIITYANDPSIIRATKKFKEGFESISTDLKVDDTTFESMNVSLNNYFSTQFLPVLERNLKSDVKIGNTMSDKKEARILQYQYISNNPHPLGSKLLLESADTLSSYGKTHLRYHPSIKNYLEKFGYYDIFIVDDETGNIVYSVFKEVDYATSLFDGPFSNTNLAEAFKETVKSKENEFTYLVDYHPYHPSYNAPAAFISTPIYDEDEKIGVLIFQMPIDRINNIMTNNKKWKDVGLGMSGETYIVGSDFTLRNQSRFLIEDSTNYFKMIKEIGVDQNTIDLIRKYNSTIGLQEVKTFGTEDAIKGNTASKIFNDYRGVPVLSAYRPLSIPNMNWVIMSEIDEAEAFEGIYKLRKNIIIAFSVLLILIIIISLIVSRQITKPLKELSYDAMELSKGNMNVEILQRKKKDEIGILSVSFRKMQSSINNLISELKHINQNLENKVKERTIDLHRQKEMVEEKNKEIVDSINYAKRLQQAILPPISLVKQSLPDSFILFKPKDIVSGDFYWYMQSGDELLIAVADCTGHGVPGAMVSVVGANGLNRCVKEFGLKQPSEILDKLCDLVIETFEMTDHDVKDGMDIAICAINLKTKKIQFSGANNPLWMIRKNGDDLKEIKADKQPIGKFEYRKHFTNHEVEFQTGDALYLFSDGYADQFGGPGGKKFKYKTLKDLLLTIHQNPMSDQEQSLSKAFSDWKGSLEQIDDVCVIGIKL